MPSTSVEPGLDRAVGEIEAPVESFRWRHPILALSMAHLSLIQAWHGLLFERDFGYFNRIPVNRPSLLALLVNLAGLTALLWAAGKCLGRLNRPGLWTLANIAVCGFVLVPLNFARMHFWNLTGARFDSLATQPLVIALGLLVLIVTIWFHRYSARIVMAAYLLVSPMVLFTVAKTAWWMVRPPIPWEGERLMARAASSSASPRVVWILLDELDQRVAFEARPANVELPELTRLYNECFRATNAFPPGGSTRYSLPALTIGREVRGARPTSAGELSFNGSSGWSEAETVFSRARVLGHSTALVGWFHPYGRVLGAHLDRCEWYSYPPFEEERGETLSEAAVNQLCSVFSQFQRRRLHIKNFRASETAALNFLTNSPAGLTLLHMPVPHHPGIYDVKHGRLTAWRYSRSREYLDNLILADQLLGTLRRAIEQAGAWDASWVLLSSDHWWRGAAGYDGKIDYRVPFIVKAPGENEPATYGNKFNTVVTYHLILAILKGELTQGAQLPKWLDTFRTDPPAGYRPNGEPF